MKIKLSLIAALSKTGGIGKNNDLLFYISDDLKRFKKLTTGNTIIMGRKTFESLPNGPLPNRDHIILSRDKSYNAPGCVVVHTVDEVLTNCNSTKESFVIGGGEIYTMLLPFCSKLYLTRVDKDVEADIFFPELNLAEWEEVVENNKILDEKSNLYYQYVNYIRKTSMK